MASKILYVQYTDPAAYPPIEHSSNILAKRGWDVVILGTKTFGDTGMTISDRPRILSRYLNRNKRRVPLFLHYFCFLVWCLYWVITWRPTWIYASDPLVTPIAWFLQRLTSTPIVYHEHDAPQAVATHSTFQKVVRRCRNRLGASAQLCVIPQHARLTEFVRRTGRQRRSICVWNCPGLDEVDVGVQRDEASVQERPLLLYYHGSINEERLPLEVIAAAAHFRGAVKLRIGGYEAPGSHGHVDKLMEIARESGCPDIIDFVGIVPTRTALFESAAKADIGLSLISMKSNDPNLRHMVGASNKPFDYMICGLPLLVSEDPDWIATFVKPGYGRACDPSDVASIIDAVSWYRNNPEARRAMRDRCMAQIRASWNYEAQFTDVVSELESNCAGVRSPTKRA